VCRGLTGGGGAIVARGATARGHRGVIHGRWLPRRGAVAVITRGRGDNVCRGLTRGRGAVMTRGTGTRRNGAVIHGRWLPRRGGVTAITR